MQNESTEPREDIQDDEVIGRALRRSLWIVSAVVLMAVTVLVVRQFTRPDALEEAQTEIVLPQERATESLQLPMIPLKDITESSGVDWIHCSGMEGDKLLPETMGGGVAIFDYDQDGDQDVLFVGGTSWQWAKNPTANPRSLCLYANDGHASFTEVTKQVGLDRAFYGMGPCIGDFDNDGWPDLFVTAVGSNVLFHNENGTFIDVTDQAGLAGRENGWSTGASWFDYDRDGLLDLFVCDYVIWNRDLDQSLGFSLTGVGRAYGQPTSFTGTQSRLYRNQGGGQFLDVSEAAGIFVANPDTGVPVGKGLAVAAVDVDEDGWQDLIVSNDTVRNFLFLNKQGKQFEESGVPLGIAFDRNGNSTGAMGIDCGYFRNDDSLAVAIGNFANEQSSLYVSRGAGVPFFDEAMASGLGPMSRLNLTFGMFFADLDLDSRLDIVCSNGHLEEEIAKVQASQQYAQPPQYFWNAGKQGSSEFVQLGEEQVGPDALGRMVGRGAAGGDLDGDGDLDVVLVANSGKPRILRNDQQLGHHWVSLLLEGSGESNRDAIGALVTLVSGDTVRKQLVVSTRSYLSQCQRAITFGLGQNGRIDSLAVTWPSGLTESFRVSADSSHRIIEGQGQAE